MGLRSNNKIFTVVRKGALIMLSILFTSASQAQVDSTFDIYLLIGQSNMAGRGEVTDQYKTEGNPNILMLDKANNWVQAKHPLHFDKPSVAGVGPGLSFALEMLKVSKGHKIGLIPCAVGGTSINVWQAGGYDNATKTHPWDDAMVRLKIAMQSGIIKGVLWLQGEADSDSVKSLGYLDKIQDLIRRLRVEADNPALPFVAGELGRYKDQYDNINRKLAKLPGTMINVAVASSEGLKDKGDQTHFDSPSAEELGRRFATEMRRLQIRLRK